jgi:8-oxo-dGTP pyrophosphatase MutT (NUDIX family)
MAGGEAVDDNEALRDRVRSNLARFDARPHADEALRHAAVAAVLTTDSEHRPSFVITRRTSRLRDHPGQWALPGGSLDAGETPEQAALRELAEEIGLELSSSAAIGRLDDYPTRSGFRITPVVVWAGAQAEMIANPDEVAEVYRVPLAVLDRPEVPRLRRIPESDRPVISIPMLNTHINAPTAAIIYQLREVAIHGRQTRVAHFEQPVFAWK